MTKIHRTSGWLLLALAAFALPLVVARTAKACTGIDFSVSMPGWTGPDFTFAGRTMEFGPDFAYWKVLYFPRGAEYRTCQVSGLNVCRDKGGNSFTGFSWPAKYAAVGFAPMRSMVDPANRSKKLEYTLAELNDGINENGLYCAGFYHMGSETYSQVPYGLGQKNLSDLDFVSWVLGRFGSVAELKAVLADEKDPVQVRQFAVEFFGKTVTDPSKFPQEHYKVVDKSGAAIIIEFPDGKAKIFDSVGVVTNNPTYDWQVTNLRNYVNLQTNNHESAQFMGTPYLPLSNGTGGLGLPGDFTSPSRFIRAMYFLNATYNNPFITVQTPEEAVLRAFRILNQFDIPEGSVVELHPDNPKKATLEATSWTSMADLKDLRYYYHTMDSRTIRMVDLGDLVKRIPTGDKPLTIELPSNETIFDVTDQFKAK